MKTDNFNCKLVNLQEHFVFFTFQKHADGKNYYYG